MWKLGLMNAISCMAPLLDGDATTTTTTTGTFSIITFFQNTAAYLKNIGHYLMVLAGIILIIVAIIQIAKGLAGGGRGQVNWVMSIACLLVGGMLIFGGWNLATSVAKIGSDTLTELGGGSLGTIDATADGGGTNVGSGFTKTTTK